MNIAAILVRPKQDGLPHQELGDDQVGDGTANQHKRQVRRSVDDQSQVAGCYKPAGAQGIGERSLTEQRLG